MQHEVLAACFGCPGNIIQEQKVGTTSNSDYNGNFMYDTNTSSSYDSIGSGIFKVTESAASSFLTKAETEAINRVVKLGYLYRILLRFSKGQPLTSTAAAVMQPSLYLRALRDGVSELLSEYATCIANIEQDLLEDPTLSISYIHHRLREYQCLFPVIASLCEAVLVQGARGGQLLQLLYTRSGYGTPTVREKLLRLLWHCHQVLFNQISAWCLHGVLMDPHLEFFVEHTTHRHDDPLVKLSRGDGWGVQNSSRSNETSETAEHNWNEEYVIAGGTGSGVSMLPGSYFPSALAHRILFVGKAVQALQAAQPKHVTKDSSDISSINNSNAGSAFGAGVCLGNDEVARFTKLFSSLKDRDEFHLLSLDHAVDQVHAAVATRLWHLVVQEGRLLLHLQAIKDYLLLGKGELHHLLAVSCAQTLTRAPCPAELARLNLGPLQASARACGLEEDEFFQRVSFTLDFPSVSRPVMGDITNFILSGDAVHDKEAACVVLCSSDGTDISTGIQTGYAPSGGKPGAMWYALPRNVRGSFTTTCAFRYTLKRQPNIPTNTNTSTYSSQNRRESTTSNIKNNVGRRISLSPLPTNDGPAGVCIVLQSLRSRALGWGYGGMGSDGLPGSVSVCVDVSGQRTEKSGPPRQDLGTPRRDSTFAGAPRQDSGTPRRDSVTPRQDISTSSPSGATVFIRSHCSADPDALIIASTERGVVQLNTSGPNFVCVDVHVDNTNVNAGACTSIHVYINDPDKRRPPCLEAKIPALNIILSKGRHNSNVNTQQAHVYNIEDSTNVPTNVYAGVTASGVGLTSSIVQWSFSPIQQNIEQNTKNTENSTGGSASKRRRPDHASENSSSSGGGLSSGGTWSDLQLQYKVEWPLHLILTQEAMAEYGIISALLLRVKRACTEVEQLWPILLETKYRSPTPDARLRLSLLWRIRAALSFYTTNLQYYLQVDVIESEFTILRTSITEAVDFGATLSAHAKFVARLRQKAMIGASQISNAITAPLQTAVIFCSAVGRSNDATQVPVRELEKIEAQLHKELVSILNLLDMAGARELATRLDYNGWISSVASGDFEGGSNSTNHRRVSAQHGTQEPTRTYQRSTRIGGTEVDRLSTSFNTSVHI